jgi:hypothetical protein
MTEKTSDDSYEVVVLKLKKKKVLEKVNEVMTWTDY